MKKLSGYLGMTLLLTGTACNTGPSYNVNPANVPAAMLECDAPCSILGAWTFNGLEGQSRWQQGTVAKLTVDRFDAGGVIIRRADTGSSSGLTSVYSGTISGNMITGSDTTQWPGHWKNRTLAWRAQIMSPQQLQATLEQAAQQKRQGQLQAQTPMTPEQRAQVEANEKLLLVGLLGAMMSDGGDGGGGGSGGGSSGVSNQDFTTQANHFYMDEHPDQHYVSGPYMR
jgi:hypothetical protein